MKFKVTKLKIRKPRRGELWGKNSVGMTKGVAKGLFGVPSFIVDGRLFFGQDRMQWFLN